MPDTREPALVRYKDEPHWTISSTDPAMIGLLRRRGYAPDPADATDPYRVFRIPAKAVSIRSKSAVEAKREISPASLDALRMERARNRRKGVA